MTTYLELLVPIRSALLKEIIYRDFLSVMEKCIRDLPKFEADLASSERVSFVYRVETVTSRKHYLCVPPQRDIRTAHG